MVFYLQFDVRREFKVSVQTGSHFAVFMSPAVNEISNYETVRGGKPLPDRFWEQRGQHFKVFLFGSEVPLVAQPKPDPYLVHQRLEFTQEDDPSDPFLYVGGMPRWYQDEEQHPGFEFLAQLSENYPFPKLEGAPPQPDSFSRKDYCLFLGNSIYFFTRPTPLHPEEVWIVEQN